MDFCDNNETNKSVEGKQNDSQTSFGPTIMNLNQFKAGMSGLDTKKINQIIHKTSKGSNFQKFQSKRQERIDFKINAMKSKLNECQEWQRMNAMTEVNHLCQMIEHKRCLNRIIVHFDLDMFFAAVEIKHNPELEDKPIAVGSMSMISTSNYRAREFGVRAAMPGFVAKQLCPQLLLIKSNFHRYSEESEAVMKIISEFDPNFHSYSLDETYIDLTDYVIDNYSLRNNDFDKSCLDGSPVLPPFLWQFAYETVETIREKIRATTQLTVSAGISANTMIAKVCTDVRKPNGQHMVKGFVDEIQQFLTETEVRKICGIGPVRAQYLNALDIKTCQDLWTKRDVIQLAFSPFNVEYYMRVALGIGSVFMRSDESRKSMSCERTFWESCDLNLLCDKLQDMSQRLESDLKSENQSCKTVTLKLKKTTFEVSLKSQTISKFTNDWETIFKVGKALLENEFNNTDESQRKYRLIGLKVSNLRDNAEPKVSKNQLTLSQMFNLIKTDNNCGNNNTTSDYSSETEGPNDSSICNFQNDSNESDLYECSICGQTFKHKYLFECHENDCIDDEYNISANSSFEAHQQDMGSDSYHNSDGLEVKEMDANSDLIIDSIDKSEQIIDTLCPVCCHRFKFKDNSELNKHLDICLNKTTCQQLTQIPKTIAVKSGNNSTPNSKSGKRLLSDTNNQKSKSRKQMKVSSAKKSSQRKIDSFFNCSQ